MHFNKKDQIEWFLDGALSVSDDVAKILSAAIRCFGENDGALIARNLYLRTNTITPVELQEHLNNRDIMNDNMWAELKAAKKAGIVIVIGCSDDRIELYGAIRAVEECFDGGDYHFAKKDDSWVLESGHGPNNNITANWYDRNITTEYGEVIPWSYKSDIPHLTFYMTYDGDPWCEGMIFSLTDLNELENPSK